MESVGEKFAGGPAPSAGRISATASMDAEAAGSKRPIFTLRILHAATLEIMSINW